MIKIIDIGIYGCSAVFLVGISDKELKKFANDYSSVFTLSEITQVKDSMEDGSSVTIPCRSLDYLVYINDKDDIAAVTHEIFHLAYHVLSERGIAVDLCEEAYAYLIGWLAQTFKDKFLIVEDNEGNVELGSGE
jgi:hypothetical protein